MLCRYYFEIVINDNYKGRGDKWIVRRYSRNKEMIDNLKANSHNKKDIKLANTLK